MSAIQRRILLTNMYGQIGGGEVCLLHHMRSLRQEGIDVTLLLLESGPFEQEARNAGADVVVKRFAWRGGKLRSALALSKQVFASWTLLRSLKPAVVCCYTFNDFVTVGLAARIAGVPVVWRTQGEMVPERAEDGSTWLGKRLRAVTRLIRPVIASTTLAEAEGLKAMDLGARWIGCVQLGTPLLDVQPPPANDVARLGMFGRLVEWKGQHVFVAALLELKRRGVRFEAWIVGGSAFGDGAEYEQRLTAYLQEHGLNDTVKLLGFRKDVPTLMSQCNVICHCSSFEPFGMVIIEAMMLGRPVVATRVRGPLESLVDGHSGLLVPAEDPRAYADALENLIGDERLRLSMGTSARDRAVSMFSIEASMRALGAAVNIAIEGAQGPPPSTVSDRSH